MAGRPGRKPDLVAEVPTGEPHQWEADQNLDCKLKAALDALNTLYQPIQRNLLAGVGLIPPS